MIKTQEQRLYERGFNLVEISVVLAIVALLVGGILRGTELTNAARARNIIDQKSSIQMSLLAFTTRYSNTAGDLTMQQALFIDSGGKVVASTSTPGDGAIALADLIGTATDESVLVFQNLRATGLLLCNTCNAVGNAAALVTNSPVNANNGYLQFGTVAPASATAGAPFWLDPVGATARHVLITGNGISDAILAQVDVKADDGVPSSGAFRQSSAGNASSTANCTTVTGAGAAAVYAWSTSGIANCAGAWHF